MSKRPPPIPGRPAPTTSEKKYCKATWDYNANEPGELNFKIGDIITIVTEDPSGWWVGELNGQKGQFPLNFTEVYTPAPSVPKPTRATPSPEPTPVTEVKSAPSPIGGGGDPMAELRAKLANRSTIAPGELSPVKKEVEPTETSTPHKINLKPADSSGPCLIYFILFKHFICIEKNFVLNKIKKTFKLIISIFSKQIIN